MTGMGSIVRCAADKHRTLHNAWWSWVLDHNSNPDKAALVGPDVQSSEIDPYDWQVQVALGLRRFFVGVGGSPVIGAGPEDMK
jgi:hypothetical protein